MAKAKNRADKPVKKASLFRVMFLTVALLAAVGVLLAALVTCVLALVVIGMLFGRLRRARKSRAEARKSRAEARASRSRRGKKQNNTVVDASTDVAAVNDPVVEPVAA